MGSLKLPKMLITEVFILFGSQYVSLIEANIFVKLSNKALKITHETILLNFNFINPLF
jgi:hypothetical protein